MSQSRLERLAALVKQADLSNLQVGFRHQIAGTPFALQGSEMKDERLPGMRRWVDRDMIQRAMQARAQGMSEDEFMRHEGGRNSFVSPLLGAGVGASLGHGAPDWMTNHLPGKAQGPLARSIIGGLLGAGAGAAYHAYKGDDRRGDAHEAWFGAGQNEKAHPRSALPTERRSEGSSSAVPPTLLTTAPAVAT